MQKTRPTFDLRSIPWPPSTVGAGGSLRFRVLMVTVGLQTNENVSLMCHKRDGSCTNLSGICEGTVVGEGF